MKEDVSIRLVSRWEELPAMACHDFFHSMEFFRMLEATPKQQPCMAIAEDACGNVVAHMLTIISYHTTPIPPFLYTHGRVYGEGEYGEGVNREHVFGLMLNAVTSRFSHRACLYIEFSDMSTKMFAYKHFRRNGYFPIAWQEIHNSLHSMPPDERISPKILDKVNDSKKRGVATTIVADEDGLQKAYKLLKNHFRLKSRRMVPSVTMFRQLMKSSHCKIFLTTYKNRAIGCCVCLYSGKDAYLWYLASLKKTYIYLHPNAFTVWSALKNAHDNGYDHFRFMDAGLPFKNNPAREFILGFGGKPVSKFRWFKLPISWLNKFFAWCYND